MLEREILLSYMHNFYGYGAWTARLWFVGMEEGGGNTLDEIQRRLAAWDQTNELADLYEFHRNLPDAPWFGTHPRIQKTWGKLIRIALCAEGRPPTTEDVRRYQRDELGRRDGSTALIELFPLPSPSTQHWTYSQCNIAEIATRECYRDAIAEHRINAIRDRIRTARPRAIIFYGREYRQYWERIAQTPFTRHVDRPFDVALTGSTIFILAPHPVARGVTNAEFCEIGRVIARGGSFSQPQP